MFFFWQKIYWPNKQLFIREVGKGVESPPAQSVLGKRSSVGRSLHMSMFSTGNCQPTRQSLVLVVSITN